jgi:hypothetical protein
MLAGMAGSHGLAGPTGAADSLFGIAYGAALYGGIDETVALAALALVTFLAPNTQEILARYRPGLATFPSDTAALPPLVAWRPRPAWAVVMVGALLLALSRMSGISPFLYYQF